MKNSCLQEKRGGAGEGACADVITEDTGCTPNVCIAGAGVGGGENGIGCVLCSGLFWDGGDGVHDGTMGPVGGGGGIMTSATRSRKSR